MCVWFYFDFLSRYIFDVDRILSHNQTQFRSHHSDFSSHFYCYWPHIKICQSGHGKKWSEHADMHKIIIMIGNTVFYYFLWPDRRFDWNASSRNDPYCDLSELKFSCNKNVDRVQTVLLCLMWFRSINWLKIKQNLTDFFANWILFDKK